MITTGGLLGALEGWEGTLTKLDIGTMLITDTEKEKLHDMFKGGELELIMST